MKRRRSNLFYFAYLVLASLIYSSICFYNGYPLLTSDSGDYIDLVKGANGVFFSRLEAYYFFVSIASLKSSLYFVVIIQGLILSYMLDVLIRIILGDKTSYPLRISIHIFMAAFTGVSWYSSQIMTDIFTPIGVIAIMILVLKPNLKRYSKIFIYILILFSMITHKSNLLLFSFLIVCLILIITFLKNYRKYFFSLTKISILITFILLAWAGVPLVKKVIYGKYKMHSKAHVFYSARMLETGLLGKVLEEECENSDNLLCDYKDSMPYKRSVYLWSPKSPIKKLNAWEENEYCFNQVIKNSIVKPKFLIAHIGWSFQGFISQLVTVNVGRLLWNQSNNWEVTSAIKKKFKHEYNAFRNAKQNNGSLSFKFYNKNRFYVLIISLVVVLYFLFYLKKMSPTHQLLLLSIILTIIGNAALTAPLAGVSARYQGKIIWVLPLLSILLLIKYRKEVLLGIRAFFDDNKNIKVLKEKE